jgi:hypothetical protein
MLIIKFVVVSFNKIFKLDKIKGASCQNYKDGIQGLNIGEILKK